MFNDEDEMTVVIRERNAKEMVFKMQIELVRGSVAKMGQILEKTEKASALVAEPIQDRSDSEAVIQELRSMLTVFLVDINKQRGQIHELESRLQTRDSLVRRYCDESLDKGLQIEQLNEQVAQMKAAHAKEISSLEAQLKELNADRDTLKRSIIVLENDVQVLTQKLEKEVKSRATQQNEFEEERRGLQRLAVTKGRALSGAPPTTPRSPGGSARASITSVRNGSTASDVPTPETGQETPRELEDGAFDARSAYPDPLPVAQMVEDASPRMAPLTPTHMNAHRQLASLGGTTHRVAIVVTAIQGSAVLWEQHAAAMRRGIVTHHSIMRSCLKKCNGIEVKCHIDQFMMAFRFAYDAARFALLVQSELVAAEWPLSLCSSAHTELRSDPHHPGRYIWKGLRVKMGLHWGEALSWVDPITGRTDLRTVDSIVPIRFCQSAGGGEILLSDSAYQALQSQWGDLPSHMVKPAGQVPVPDLTHSIQTSNGPSRRLTTTTLLSASGSPTSRTSSISGMSLSGIPVLGDEVPKAEIKAWRLLPAALAHRAEDLPHSRTIDPGASVEVMDAMISHAPTGEVTVVFISLLRSAEVDVSELNTPADDPFAWYYDRIANEARRRSGYEVRHERDRILIVFPKTSFAMLFCLHIQESMNLTNWPAPFMHVVDNVPIKWKDSLMFNGPRIQIGVHRCQCTPTFNPLTKRVVFEGEGVYIASALAVLCKGGEIMITRSVFDDVAESMEVLDNPIMCSMGKYKFVSGMKPVPVYQVLPRALEGRAFIIRGFTEDSPEAEIEAFQQQIDMEQEQHANDLLKEAARRTQAETERLEQLRKAADERAAETMAKIEAERTKIVSALKQQRKQSQAFNRRASSKNLIEAIADDESDEDEDKKAADDDGIPDDDSVFGGAGSAHSLTELIRKKRQAAQQAQNNRITALRRGSKQPRTGGEASKSGGSSAGGPRIGSGGSSSTARGGEGGGAKPSLGLNTKALLKVDGMVPRLSLTSCDESTGSGEDTGPSPDAIFASAIRLLAAGPERESVELARMFKEDAYLANPLVRATASTQDKGKGTSSTSAPLIQLRFNDLESLIRILTSQGVADAINQFNPTNLPMGVASGDSIAGGGRAAPGGSAMPMTSRKFKGQKVSNRLLGLKSPRGGAFDETEVKRLLAAVRGPSDAGVAGASSSDLVGAGSGGGGAGFPSEGGIPAEEVGRVAAELTASLNLKLEEIKAKHSADVIRCHKLVRYWCVLMKDWLAPFDDDKKSFVTDEEFVSKWIAFTRTCWDKKPGMKRKSKEEFKEFLIAIMEDEDETNVSAMQLDRMPRSLVGHLCRSFLGVKTLIRKKQKLLASMGNAGQKLGLASPGTASRRASASIAGVASGASDFANLSPSSQALQAQNFGASADMMMFSGSFDTLNDSLDQSFTVVPPSPMASGVFTAPDSSAGSGDATATNEADEGGGQDLVLPSAPALPTTAQEAVQMDEKDETVTTLPAISKLLSRRASVKQDDMVEPPYLTVKIPSSETPANPTGPSAASTSTTTNPNNPPDVEPNGPLTAPLVPTTRSIPPIPSPFDELPSSARAGAAGVSSARNSGRRPSTQRSLNSGRLAPLPKTSTDKRKGS